MNAFAYWALLMFAISLTACTYDQLEAPDNCLAPLELEVINSTPSSCGLSIGGFEVRVLNPSPEQELVNFSIDGENFQGSGQFDNLSAGVYLVRATNGSCEASLELSIDNEEGLNASLQSSASACTSPTGSIQINATNAQGEVRYSLNGSAAQSSAVFEDLAPGEYQIIATDDSGCSISLETTILSDVSFATVDAIIRSNCAVSGCHNGNVSPDLRNASTIRDRANRIQTRTGARSMPPSSSGRSLTQNQIDAIQCWVEDGAPQ
ncbi:MAG: hypothetical protein AAF433_22225 [Bacteroidota bacterium]